MCMCVALIQRSFGTNQVLVELKSAIWLLRHALKSHPDKDNIAIAFPDDGAHKRYHISIAPHNHTPDRTTPAYCPTMLHNLRIAL